METSASVICKELGFGHAVDWFGLHNDIIGLPGEIYSNVVISTFICPSSESSSEECLIDVDSNIKCRNTEKGATNPVLAVVCKPSPGYYKNRSKYKRGISHEIHKYLLSNDIFL